MNVSRIQAEIDNCSNGFCLEIGGPTPQGFVFLSKLGLKLPNNITISNVVNPVILEPFGDHPKKYIVDEVIDIQNLPYTKGQVDMIITSSLPNKLHKVLFKESAKVLRKNGLLIIENEQLEDVEFALEAGFRPLIEKKIARELYSQIYSFVD